MGPLQIDPTTRNGSFEADTGKQTTWAGVTDWDYWGPAVAGPGTANTDSGSDTSASASDGTRVSFIQTGGAAYNMTAHILAVGDTITYTWDHVLRADRIANVNFVYETGGNVIAFGVGTTSNGVTLDTYTETYTVQAGDAWVGSTVGLGVAATNYPELDNFTLEVTPIPEPSSVTLLGLGGLALIIRHRKS
ncbi:MAG: PEP-CTERM sorting domain-containing protein [Akkermansiaceae bacterium]